MVARVTGFAFTFLIPIVLSRVLDLKQFGLYKQAFLIVATAQSILPLGFGMSTFYFLSREHEERKRAAIAGNALLFHVLVGTLAASDGILLAWNSHPHLWLRRPGSLLHPDCSHILVLDYLIPDRIHRNRKPGRDVLDRIHHHGATHQKHRHAVGGFVDTVCRGCAVCGYVPGNTADCRLLWYLGLSFPAYWRRFSFSILRLQVSYTLPLGLAGLIYTLQNDMHNYFVSNAFGRPRLRFIQWV